MGEKLYIVTRADLAPGAQIAQAVHAHRLFVAEHPLIEGAWFTGSNTVAIKVVPDRAALTSLVTRARWADVAVSVFREPDLGDEETAAAFAPGDGGHAFCGKLPLAGAPARPLVGAGLIVRHAATNAILLGRRRGDETEGCWAPIMGKVEGHELLFSAGARELGEETGLAVSADRIVDLGLYTHDREPADWPAYVTLWCEVEVTEQEARAVRVMEPEKCFEWRWFDDAPDPLIRCLNNLRRRGYDPWVGQV